jgi:hypothetical protein
MTFAQHWFTQQKWFVGMLKKQTLVGTTSMSLCWESIVTQSITDIIQIENWLSQWHNQVLKDILNFMASYNHQSILDSIKIKS